ncbi:MAG: NAD(P)H-hydrate dehydratase, partial [Verrucomicrobiota bacterium]|nr:NAD(P)H-hydrate dehydratase [Verrucomicrobiota bacterium]
FGFRFRAPLDAAAKKIINRVNAAATIRLRAAVDLPSGVGEATAKSPFRADFTYATGILKAPLLSAPAAGRLRYLDFGFFSGNSASRAGERVLTAELLRPLTVLRPSRSDKRSYGHVFVIGGSRGLPGAVLMAVLAALRSGVGLVTAFVPEPLVAEFAARAPEAMWVGWPVTSGGGLAMGGLHLLQEKLPRAKALVIGPGLGREAETLKLACEIVRIAPIPLAIDGDALQPRIVRSGRAPRVLTPHAGEFKRISQGAGLRAFCRQANATTVLKGPVTQICSYKNDTIYHSLFGGPVLARGGSGDVLAGLIGGLLAQTPGEPLLAACRGVVWHGLAADELARKRGQAAARTTESIDFLPSILRNPPT